MELDDYWADLTPHFPVASHATSSSSNHSEIEKRRRDRMNELMRELAALIPATSSRKLNKLSVLRLALDYITAMSTSNDKELHYESCAKHITFSNLLNLLKKNIEHFLTVVDVSSGKILYASDEMCNFFGHDLLERNWYEVLHPVDAAIFKKETSMECFGSVNANDSVCEAISSSTGSYKQKAEWNLGFRRFFQCRFQIRHSKDSDRSEHSYESFRCSGLLRNVGRPVMVILLIKPLSPGTEESFQIIVSPNGRIIRCEPELPSILNRLPQDLTGCCYYDLVHEGDLLDVACHHKKVLSMGESRETSYRIRVMNKSCIKVDATWIPFTNPWNLKRQFVIVNHRSNSVGCDEESCPEQSILKQLLSNKKLHKDCQGKTIHKPPEKRVELRSLPLRDLLSRKSFRNGTEIPAILGVARLGESVTEES